MIFVINGMGYDSLGRICGINLMGYDFLGRIYVINEMGYDFLINCVNWDYFLIMVIT